MNYEFKFNLLNINVFFKKYLYNIKNNKVSKYYLICLFFLLQFKVNWFVFFIYYIFLRILINSTNSFLVKKIKIIKTCLGHTD